MESGGESLSRLEALPEGIMQLVTKNIIDYKGWFALATINTRFKNLMYDPSRLLVEAAAHVGGKFGILGVPENEQAGMHFYELAAAHGNVEAMLMCGESLRRAEDDAGTGAGAERLFRAALAREGDVHDERHFLLMRPAVNAFSRARYRLAEVVRSRCATGEVCLEATSLLRSVVALGPPGPECIAPTYIDAVIMLSEMEAEGQTGAGPSLQRALAIVEAVAEPDGVCHFMMGRLHAEIMKESGEQTPTAYTHHLTALRLGDEHAAYDLGQLYESGRGIPDDHRDRQMFIAILCYTVAAFKYMDFRALGHMMHFQGLNLGENTELDGHLAEVKAWAFERMGAYLGLVPNGGTMTLVEALASFDSA